MEHFQSNEFSRGPIGERIVHRLALFFIFPTLLAANPGELYASEVSSSGCLTLTQSEEQILNSMPEKLAELVRKNKSRRFLSMSPRDREIFEDALNSSLAHGDGYVVKIEDLSIMDVVYISATRLENNVLEIRFPEIALEGVSIGKTPKRIKSKHEFVKLFFGTLNWVATKNERLAFTEIRFVGETIVNTTLIDMLVSIGFSKASYVKAVCPVDTLLGALIGIIGGGIYTVAAADDEPDGADMIRNVVLGGTVGIGGAVTLTCRSGKKGFDYGLTLSLKSPPLKANVRSPLFDSTDVKLEDVKMAWDYQFRDSVPETYVSIKNSIELLNSWQTAIREGDTHRFDLFPNEVRYTINGKTMGSISGTEFRDSILLLFFGDRPPTKDLKRGLLSGMQKGLSE